MATWSDVVAIASVLPETEESTWFRASGDPAFYTTPHYDGYGAILIDLARIDPDHLTELITSAWRLKAPAKLRKTHDLQQ